MAGKLTVNSLTNLAGSGYIQLADDTGLDLSNSTSGIILPQGTTEQRPAVGYEGSIRYNTSTQKVEYYDGSQWLNSDGSVAVVIAGDAADVTRYLVYALSDGGTANGVSNPLEKTITDIDAATAVSNGIHYVPIADAFASIPWKRAIFTSYNKPWVQWAFERETLIERVISALLSPYSNWSNYMSVNSALNPSLAAGSSIKVGEVIQFMHNNGGGEPYDIPTLGNAGGYVWSSGMYWGQIDSVTNYGGILNRVVPQSGSSGGNTGDTLLLYLSTEDSPIATDYINYLTPTGPFGNAQNFAWSYDGTAGLGGNVTYVADASDHVSAGSWTSQGFQQNGTDRYMQVILPSPQSFDYTFAIGYANGSHYSDRNLIEGSNDGSSWTTMAEWTYHNGTTNAHGYLYYNSGSHTYSNTINNVNKWIPMDNTKAFKYWRIRGTNFAATNNYQLVANWALLKKS